MIQLDKNNKQSKWIEGHAKDLETAMAMINRLKSELKESEDRYDRLIENVKEEILFFRHDTQGNFTYVSPSYANILGYTPDEYTEMHIDEMWTPNPINVEAADLY